MIKSSTFGMSVAAFAGSLALLSLTAAAQTTTTAPAPAAPAVKAPAPVAPKTATPVKAAAVVCKGLVEAACKTEATACSWIVPKKVEANGKIDKAYCRTVAGVAKKAAVAKTEAKAPATTTPSTTSTTPPAKK